MPTVDGIEATKRLLQAADAPRVLILTTFDLDEYVYAAMKAGASGFLLKDAPREQLIGAIKTVARGEALLAPAITRRLIEQFVRRPPPGATVPPGLGEPTRSLGPKKKEEEEKTNTAPLVRTVVACGSDFRRPTGT